MPFLVQRVNLRWQEPLIQFVDNVVNFRSRQPVSFMVSRATAAGTKRPAIALAKPVEKRQVLKMLEPMEDEESSKRQALSVAHDENVSA